MNQKIKQLAEQAGLLGPSCRSGNAHEATEKFAELIIQECMDVVESQKAKMSYGPTFVIEDIKQHFGVEQ